MGNSLGTRVRQIFTNSKPIGDTAKRSGLPETVPVRLQTKMRLLSSVIFVAGFALILFVGIKKNSASIAIEIGTGMMGLAVAYSLLKPFVKSLSDADGLVTNGIDYRDFALSIRRSKRQVRILSTFIWPLTKRTRDQANKNLLLHAMRDAVCQNQQMEIRILFLDPYSEAAKQRAEELSGMREDAILRIQESLLALHRFQQDLYPKECAARIEVRLYDRLPPLSLYQWDNRASFSSYPREKEISRTRRFEFPMTTPLGGFVDGLFWDIWDDVQTKSLHEYIYTKIQIEVNGSMVPEFFEVHFVSLEHERQSIPCLLLNHTRDRRAIQLFQEYLAAPTELRVSQIQGDNQRSFTYWARASLQASNIIAAATRKYEHFEYQEIIRLYLGSSKP